MQTFLTPTQTELMQAAVDIASPAMGVEISFTPEEDKLWVNVDGVCVLRIQGIKRGTLEVKVPNGS